MKGKEFRKELKRLFKKLELDDIEIGVSDISALYICNVNLDALFEDETLSYEERDQIWGSRKKYVFRYDKDEKRLYAENVKPKKDTRIY